MDRHLRTVFQQLPFHKLLAANEHIDPVMEFGKTLAQNLEVIRRR